MIGLLRIPNVRLLVAAQAIGMSATPFNTLLGGIVGARLAPDPRLSTLPVALVIVGVAASTVPVALFMRRFGRRAGFVTAAAIAAGGAALAALGIHLQSFALFCLATPLLGVNMAAVQQYRFAVAENVTVAQGPQAVSLVLLGTLVAAFVGPLFGQHGWTFAGLGTDASAYLSVAVFLALSPLLLATYRDLPPAAGEAKGGRPLLEIAAQPRFLIAALSAAVGYGVMTLLMTATPIAMHVQHGHPMGHTGAVIQAHIAAMYLPSLFAGSLIRRFGEVRLLVAGILVMFGCAAFAATGHDVMHYAAALILLGVGWNFLFVGGTSLLTQAYRPEERFRAQAANDFLVFSITAASSLASGALVLAAGWTRLVLTGLPPLLVLLLILVAGRRRIATA